jgi:hypothetical protein
MDFSRGRHTPARDCLDSTPNPATLSAFKAPASGRDSSSRSWAQRRARPKFAKKRPAIDAIVATVLIIAVTLVASLAVSGFIFGSFGHAQNSAQVAVTGNALPAADFTSAGTTNTFTCAASSSAAYLTLTNSGTGGATIEGISITWAGSNTAYSLSGLCDIGASGSLNSTQYVIFPPTTTMSPDAATGQTYTGTVTLSNGAQLLFVGSWQ